MTSDRKKQFREWYGRNREELLEKRRERYATDPEYRAKAIARVKRRRERASPTVTSVSLKEVADRLGVTEQEVRYWRRAGYYPAPGKVGRRLYFSEDQVDLLVELKEALSVSDSVAQHKRRIVDMVDLIHMNW